MLESPEPNSLYQCCVSLTPAAELIKSPQSTRCVINTPICCIAQTSCLYRLLLGFTLCCVSVQQLFYRVSQNTLLLRGKSESKERRE